MNTDKEDDKKKNTSSFSTPNLEGVLDVATDVLEIASSVCEAGVSASTSCVEVIADIASIFD